MLLDRFCCNFYGFRSIPTVGTEKSIKNNPEPTGQIKKSTKYHPKPPKWRQQIKANRRVNSGSDDGILHGMPDGTLFWNPPWEAVAEGNKRRGPERA